MPETTTDELVTLLDDYASVVGALRDMLTHGETDERSRAHRALVVNARTVANLVRYRLEPPTFAYFLHRESIGYGGEEWTIHT